MKIRQRDRLLVAASLTVLLALAGCGPAGRDSTARPAESAKAGARAPGGSAAAESRVMGAAAEKVDDAVITAHVRAAFAADSELKAMQIDVDTRDSVVTLSGLSPSATAKEHASEIARAVRGVDSVNNQLTIRS